VSADDRWLPFVLRDDTSEQEWERAGILWQELEAELERLRERVNTLGKLEQTAGERAAILEWLVGRLREALRVSYPYVMDALHSAESNTPGTAYVIRADLENIIVPALKEKT
jgi:hypothetical protein